MTARDIRGEAVFGAWNVAAVRRLACVLSAFTLLILAGCSEPTSPGSTPPNQPPRTRLANIPVNDPAGRYPSSTPRVVLYWVGDDADGYVAGFRYRWSYVQGGVTVYRDWTTILNIMFSNYTLLVRGGTNGVPAAYLYFAKLAPGAVDSVTGLLGARTPIIVGSDTVVVGDSVQNPNPNKGVFIFESQDTLNPHTFEVEAIDNLGAVDPHPPSVTFWTPQAVAPNTSIVAPFPADSSFLIDHLTDTFPGITFYFQGSDPSSLNLEYSWSVDSVRWSAFSLTASATVTAADLRPPLTGSHVIYVKARNDYGLEDPTPASYRFTVVVPRFVDPSAPHRLLLLDMTRNGSGSLGQPSNIQINAYYSGLLDSANQSGNYDVWTTHTQGFPDRITIANYSSILLVNDNVLGELSSRFHTTESPLLSQYLSVGGKLIISSWDLPSQFDNVDTAISFFVGRVHLQSITDPEFYSTDGSYDYIGSRGALGYPDISLDQAKLPSTWSGSLRRIARDAPRGFAETIYTFHSMSDSLQYEGRPVGVRYLGATYAVIYFGVPLYFVQQPTAVAILQKALSDIGE